MHKKDEKNETKNYRPVSLLSVLSKVLESIVALRVTEHIGRHYLLFTVSMDSDGVVQQQICTCCCRRS